MKDLLFLHHSAIKGKSLQAGKINESHRRRRFPISRLGFYGGYTMLIEKNGKVVRFREYDEVHAHSPQNGANYNALAICLAGNFETEKPTKAQMKSLKKEIIKLKAIGGAKTIIGHRDNHATLCPGKNLYKLIPELRNLKPEPPEPDGRYYRIMKDEVPKKFRKFTEFDANDPLVETKALIEIHAYRSK